MPGFQTILALLALSFFAPHVAALDANSHVSVEEQAQINAWLATNRHQLNKYGDAKDTVYMGGSPLFDESTGETRNKYDYIFQTHPEKPWLKDLGSKTASKLGKSKVQARYNIPGTPEHHEI